MKFYVSILLTAPFSVWKPSHCWHKLPAQADLDFRMPHARRHRGKNVVDDLSHR